MRKYWKTLRKCQDTEEIRVLIESWSYSEEGDCVGTVLHIYFGDDLDPSMSFEAWTPEIENLSPETYALLIAKQNGENERSRGAGEKIGEQRIVDQVHRLLGVDKLITNIEDINESLTAR